MKQELLDQARLVAGAVNLEHVKKLTGSSADLTDTAYLRLNQQFSTVRSINPRYRYIYIMGQHKNGDIFFFLDVGNSGDEAKPGQIYSDVPSGYVDIFNSGVPGIEGPYTDEWGTFISAGIPIIDSTSGNVIAVLGMDIDAHAWRRDVFLRSRWLILWISVFVIVMLGLITRLHIALVQRKKAERELAKAKSYIDNIINSMPSVLVGVNKDLEVTQWNNQAISTTGIPLNKALGKKIAELMPQLNSELNSISEVIAERKIRHKTDVLRSEEHKTSHENITIYPLVTNGVEGAVIRIDDITEHAELEALLAHSRKMDAIGQLAGGVAHDFNNMLGGIIGAADILKQHLTGKDLRMIDIILQSAGRASELTTKLLAFGRKGKLSTEPVNMNEVINDAIAILERSIDKKIKLEIKRDAKRTTVNGDYSSLQNAVLNIGINASHAMPDGGSIEISTRVIKLDQMYCDSCLFDIVPGDYIEVEMRDCGCGIHPENLQRIFDPFFTTKEQGKGTGLGLSAVYGTIQEHHGAITVYSEIGVGTVFHLYLPLSDQEAKAYESSECVISGHGRILVVDDEKLIRITAQTMLQEMNYEVLLAQDGQEAVDIYSREGAKIDLILLDMIMPKMNGREAFMRLKELDPDVKIIISSGFSKDGDIDDLKEKGLCGFVRKPYRLSELSHILAQTMKTD